jgi:hypothetical protein
MGDPSPWISFQFDPCGCGLRRIQVANNTDKGCESGSCTVRLNLYSLDHYAYCAKVHTKDFASSQLPQHITLPLMVGRRKAHELSQCLRLIRGLHEPQPTRDSPTFLSLLTGEWPQPFCLGCVHHPQLLAVGPWPAIAACVTRLA